MDRPATRDELIKAVERLSDLVESQREHIDSLIEMLTIIREKFQSGEFVDVSKVNDHVDREEEMREIGGELNDIETRKIVKASSDNLTAIQKALGCDRVVEVTLVEGSTRSSLVEARERIREAIREAAILSDEMMERWESTATDGVATHGMMGALSLSTSSKDLDKSKPVRKICESPADFDASTPYVHNTQSTLYH